MLLAFLGLFIGLVDLSLCQVLTKSVDVACPEDHVVFLCIEPGFSLRWNMRLNSHVSETKAFSRNSMIDHELFINEPPLIARLVNFGLNSANEMVSRAFVNVSLGLNGAEMICSGNDIIFSQLWVATLLPPPLNFHEFYHHFFTNSSIVVLSWDPPSSSLLLNNLLDGYHVSALSHGVNVTTSETFVSLFLPGNTRNTTSILLSSCNCVGCGNPAILNWTQAVNNFTTCYVPCASRVAVDCELDLLPTSHEANESSTTTIESPTAMNATNISTETAPTQTFQTTAAEVTTNCPSSFQNTIHPAVASVMTLTIFSSISLAVLAVIQVCYILKLRRRTAPRRMQAISNVALEHSDSVRYSEQPTQLVTSSSSIKQPFAAAALRHLPAAPDLMIQDDSAYEQVTESRIDLSDNNAYTYNISDYYT